MLACQSHSLLAGCAEVGSRLPLAWRKGPVNPCPDQEHCRKPPIIVCSSETPKESEADSPVFPCTSAMLGRLTGFLFVCLHACMSICVGVHICRDQRSMHVFLHLIFSEFLTQPRIQQFVNVGWPVSLKDLCPLNPASAYLLLWFYACITAPGLFAQVLGISPQVGVLAWWALEPSPHLPWAHFCLLHYNSHCLFTQRWWSSQPAIN